MLTMKDQVKDGLSRLSALFRPARLFRRESRDEVPPLPDEATSVPLLERLILTHPVWYLPNMSRAGAVHLLQSRPAGTFIVRQSSQHSTMALTVRMPNFYEYAVDHYLVHYRTEGVRLEGSRHFFKSVPLLIAYYCANLDELPCRLTLPVLLMQATTSQQLASFAVLGQDFWTACVGKKQSGPAINGPRGDVGRRPVAVTRPYQETSSDTDAPPVPPKHSVARRPRRERRRSSPKATTNDGSPKSPTAQSPTTPTGGKEGNFTSTFYLKMEQSGEEEENGGYKQPGSTATGSSGEVQLRRSLPPSSNGTSPYQATSIDDLTADTRRSRRKAVMCGSEGDGGVVEGLSLTAPYEQTVIVDGSPPYDQTQPVESYDLAGSIPVTSLNGGGATSNGGAFTPVESSARKHGLPNILVPDFNQTHTSGNNTTNNNTNPAFSSAGHWKQKSSVGSPPYREPCDTFVLQQDLPTLQNSSVQPRPPPRSRRRSVRRSASSVSSRGSSSQKQQQQKQTAEQQRFDRLSSTLDLVPPPVSSAPVDVERLEVRTTERWVIIPEPRRSSQFSQTKGVESLENSGAFSNSPADTWCQTPTSPHRHASSHTQTEMLSPPATPQIPSITVTHTSTQTSRRERRNKQPPSSLDFMARPQARVTSMRSSFSDMSTVEDLLAAHTPELTLRELQLPVLPQQQTIPTDCVSEYDNLEDDTMKEERGGREGTRDSRYSTTTVYSRPWDGAAWHQLFLTDAVAATQTPPIGDQTDYDNDHSDSDTEDGSLGFEAATVHDTDAVSDTMSWTFRQDGVSRAHTPDSRRPDKQLPPNTPTSLSHLATVGVSASGAIEVMVPRERVSDEEEGSSEQLLDDGALPYLSTPKLVNSRNRCHEPGRRIRDFIFAMSRDEHTTFGSTIMNFVQCTKESAESDPQVVMRNVRQFMSGIKNYLVKHGEQRLLDCINRESDKLEKDEFLNIDGIIEAALHKCVIRPLKHHLYSLFVRLYTRDHSFRRLRDNIQLAREKSPQELGLRHEVTFPGGSGALKQVHGYLGKMQRAYSPLKKLENLLAAVRALYSVADCVSELTAPPANQQPPPLRRRKTLGADDLLPLLVYSLARCGLVAAEVECSYMWGLLHPELQKGEGGYYLTAFSSAVHLLKRLDETINAPPSSVNTGVSNESGGVVGGGELTGFLKVILPDERHDSLATKTLPVRPDMTVKEVAALMAHKCGTANPQDYGLYVISCGVESLLQDSQIPQTVRRESLAARTPCVFAYKRLDAKYIWPRNLDHTVG